MHLFTNNRSRTAILHVLPQHITSHQTKHATIIASSSYILSHNQGLLWTHGKIYATFSGCSLAFCSAENYRSALDKIRIRAVLNRGSLVFGRTRIIETIIWRNTNRIRIVTLNFEATSLSFVIVKINIIILDMHSCATSQIYQYEYKYICTRKVINLAKN